MIACLAPSGHVLDATDCDDQAPDSWPGAKEVCDGADQDCDGQVDEGVAPTWFMDADEDGYGDAQSPVEACEAPQGSVADDGDCDDGDERVHPGAEEICDEEDTDCDPGTEELGMVTALEAGELVDWTERFDGSSSAPVSITVSEQVETLLFCGGTHYVNLSLGHSVDLLASGPTTLDGGDQGPVIDVLPGADAFIEGFTIQHGKGKPTTLSGVEYELGGGILCYGEARLSVSSCEVVENQATHGAGIFAGAGCATAVTDSSISDNSAVDPEGTSGFGALYLFQTDASLERLTVERNQSSYIGAGVVFVRSTGRLVDSHLADNSCSYYGCGVTVFRSNGIELRELTLAESTGEVGAALWLYQGTALLEQSSVTGTRHTRDGQAAVLVESGSQLDLIEVRFSDNADYDLSTGTVDYTWTESVSQTCTAKGSCVP